MELTTARPITTGPKFHWFGYYDKLQFDPSGRYVLGMEVDFEHRDPTADETIKVGMIDLADDDRWIELGETRAWCWQQGCMLQWIPGSTNEVIWNDRQGDRFVSHVLDVRSRQKRTLNSPIYALSPDGRTAISADFRRTRDMRPGYGYVGIPDPNHDVLAPANSGIYHIDLETGSSEQIISLAEVAAIPYPHADLSMAKHYFNHLLFNPDGSRFVFLNRWRIGDGEIGTRMITAAADGSDIRVVDDYGYTSHFIWRDSETILAWSWQPSHGEAFCLFKDGASPNQAEVIGLGKMVSNGHCTFLPGNEWILNDTWGPGNPGRMQALYLYYVASGKRVDLGAYHTPEGYDDEWRCDLHPCYSPDGRLVTIDSPHDGNGRQIYLLEIGDLVSQEWLTSPRGSKGDYDEYSTDIRS